MRTGVQVGVRRALTLVAAAALVSVGLAGPAGAAKKAGKPVQGGTLTYVVQIDSQRGWWPGFSTSSNPASEYHSFRAMFDTLLWEDREAGVVKPQLLQSFSATPDAITWTLKLRPNLQFTDGTPLNAAAIKYNWELIADPKNAAVMQVVAAGIQSMEVVDDQTLKVVLKEPSGQFPRAIATKLGFVGSPKALQEKGITGFSNTPVGAGPFVFKSWVKNGDLNMDRNPNYWQKGKPYADSMLVRVVLDPEVRYQALVTGQASVIASNGAFTNFQRAADAGFPTYKAYDPTFGGSFIGLNNTKAPFNDLNARLFMLYGVNWMGMRDTIYLGGSTLFTGVARKPSAYVDPSLKWPQFDPKKAQGYLDAYLAAHPGAPLAFRMMASASSVPSFEYFLGQLKSNFKNVTPTLDPTSATDYLTKVIRGDFESVSFPVFGEDPEPDLYEAFRTGGSRNYYGYSNTEMDAQWKIVHTSLDEKERIKAFQSIQRMMIKDAPVVWYQAGISGGNPGNDGYMTAKNLKGMHWSGAGLIPEDIWFSKSKT